MVLCLMTCISINHVYIVFPLFFILSSFTCGYKNAFSTMALVNCTVVCRSTNITILPWTKSSQATVLGFYKDKLLQEVMVKCNEGPSGSQEQAIRFDSAFSVCENMIVKVECLLYCYSLLCC